MPHVSSSGGDDLGSTDEVKVFKDEGDGEDEKRSSENLTEEKSSLIDLTESEEKSGGNYSSGSKNVSRPDHSPVFGKVEPGPHTSSFNMGYLVSPYSYANGAAGPIPVSMAGKIALGPSGHPGAALPFFCHANGDPLSQPPPAHMGIPPYQLDSKASSMGEYMARTIANNRHHHHHHHHQHQQSHHQQHHQNSNSGGNNNNGQGPPPPPNSTPSPTSVPSPLSPGDWRRFGPLFAATGLTRPPMYPFSPGQYPYPMLSPEMSQVAATWHTPTMYPLSPGAGFRSPYPSTLPISTSSLPSDFYRFSPTGLIPPHPGLSPHGHLPSHPAIVTPGPKQELPDLNHRYSRQVDQKNNIGDGKNNQDNSAADKKKPHIKKPLNAFMLYMKEMRAKVVAECTLKESAAINQILGRKWHALGREEQAKYYELARRERQLHMQLYPDWSSRANATRGKKRKRKQDPTDGGNSMKKCRARYGLDQQNQWCKPCRRKKKCIRYMEAGDHPDEDGNQSDDNLGSCGSMGEAHTPPDDDETESLSQSMSSRGGLSPLSSLTSPGHILASPSTMSGPSPPVSLASPYNLQSPPTPHDAYEKLPPPPPIIMPPQRNPPVGTNPHDINNPLSVNQLTGQCIKNEPSETNGAGAAKAIISVT